MNADYIKYVLDNLIHRKLRSWLTILSILIGITAIYTLVSFGQGLSTYIEDISNDIGRDKLIIQAKGIAAPGTDDSFFITKDEVEFLSKVNGIEEIVGLYAGIIEVEHRKEKKYVFAMSINQGEEKEMVTQLLTVNIDKGRELKKDDKLKAVLGYNYQIPKKIFDKALNLGDKIKVNGYDTEIIGFYGSIGNPQDDSNIYFTEEAMEMLFPEKKDKFQFAIARAAKNTNPATIAEKAKDKLRRFKNLDEGKEDFYIQTFEQAVETFTNILAIINMILILIAFISLIVAGVNIMNTMYTTVLERTKEIGVMKAIGARNYDIITIFLIESGLLGIIGGAFGIIFGYGIAKLGGSIAASYGYSLLRPEFPIFLTIGCLLFAFIVGALAGFLPALQASKLKPVDALRYE